MTYIGLNRGVLSQLLLEPRTPSECHGHHKMYSATAGKWLPQGKKRMGNWVACIVARWSWQSKDGHQDCSGIWIFVVYVCDSVYTIIYIYIYTMYTKCIHSIHIFVGYKWICMYHDIFLWWEEISWCMQRRQRTSDYIYRILWFFEIELQHCSCVP